MELQTALKLQSEISNKFLFSRENVLALAGSWDDGMTADELVYDIFQEVFGVIVCGSNREGYRIELLSGNENLFISPILEYFKRRRNEIIGTPTSPFELRVRKRPLEIGCSVSHRLNNSKGTLGCFVKGMDDNETYILSNHHVLYNATDIDDNFIVQPCTLDGGVASDAIGLYQRSLSYSESDINEFDAAIAGPIPVMIEHTIPGMNTHVKEATGYGNDHKVYKIGAVSNTTYGMIKSSVANIRVNIDGRRYDFKNQILIQGFDDQFVNEMPFSEPGDSGSLIIDYESHNAIGLLFAGNAEGVTLANPIQPVLDKLRVRF